MFLLGNGRELFFQVKLAVGHDSSDSNKIPADERHICDRGLPADKVLGFR